MPWYIVYKLMQLCVVSPIGTLIGFQTIKENYSGSMSILCKYSVKHWWKRKLGSIGLLIVLRTLGESIDWKIKYFIPWYGVKRLFMVQLGLIRTKCLHLNTTRLSIKWKIELSMPWYIVKRQKYNATSPSWPS